MKNKKHGLTLKQRGALHGYAFISIWIIGFLVFVLYPVIYSMILSVNAIKIRPEGIIYTFKGLFFYDYALNELPHFRNCLAVQLQMVCGMTPVILVLSLIVAMLLNGKFRGRALFRAIFFMPVIIMSGPVISSLLGQYALDFSTNSRIVYDLLSYMPSALAAPVEYVLNNLVKILWMSGVQILIFLAGLQTISPSLYEASSIEGATAWENFWKITFPMIGPIILVNAVYTIIDSMTGTTNPVISKIYYESVIYGRYGSAAAMSWMYFLIVAVVLMVFITIASRNVYYEER